jgi:hypothetical protein
MSEKIYYGAREELPKGYDRFSTKLEAVKAKKINRYGRYKIDPVLLDLLFPSKEQLQKQKEIKKKEQEEEKNIIKEKLYKNSIIAFRENPDNYEKQRKAKIAYNGLIKLNKINLIGPTTTKLLNDYNLISKIDKNKINKNINKDIKKHNKIEKMIDNEIDNEINKIYKLETKLKNENNYIESQYNKIKDFKINLEPKKTNKQSSLKKEDIVNLKFKYTNKLKQQEKELKLFLKELEEEKSPKYRKEIMNDIEKTEMNIKDLQNKLNELE